MDSAIYKEKFYDDHIAPKLLALGRQCTENGLSLVAAVEWAPGDVGRTSFIVKEASFALRLVDVAIRCKGNVDSLIVAIAKRAREYGHSSAYLMVLGIQPAGSESGQDQGRGAGVPETNQPEDGEEG